MPASRYRSRQLTLLIFAADAVAEDDAAVLGDAIAGIDWSNVDFRAFTGHAVADGRTWVGRYAPGLPGRERRTPISVDGGPTVPRSVDVQFKVRALLMIASNEQEAFVHKDFGYAGD